MNFKARPLEGIFKDTKLRFWVQPLLSVLIFAVPPSCRNVAGLAAVLVFLGTQPLSPAEMKLLGSKERWAHGFLNILAIITLAGLSYNEFLMK